MSKSNTFFILAIILALYCVSGTLSTHCECGRIYDGSERGTDIDEQESTSEFTANWEGFHDEVECALVDEGQVTEKFKLSGFDAPEETRCRSGSDITGTPYIDFVKVPKGQETYTFTDLDLSRGTRYYFVLRYIEHNEPHYSNSNGCTPKEPGGGDTGSSPDESSDEHPPHNPPPSGSDSGTGGGSSSDDDDDDDDIPDWEIGLIFMGCALCCLLLLLLILLLVLAKGKGDDKYTTTVHRNDNVDKL